MQFRRLEMADRELIAAILTAGMLPPWKFRKAARKAKGGCLLKPKPTPYNEPSTMPSAFIDSS
jgi:hypothetical protein